ncbi:unnamed protein product [Microthlaspi erraticum]|uniref:HSF-type DNA-binding domain-containing protein n=1 Tax=Microthlaspi erraticum TaxID=1685480 RepID=A0A6D2IA41_9BRAS|nr:unnamed protein product [Microthlaspi erraticum]
MDYSLPTPLEGLKETGPTPFLTKTYNIVDDSSTNNIVSWSRDNNSFIVWEPETFALVCLPIYFKHKNFSSFVRQLNTYGFKKIDTERWEFANVYFLRGQRHLLKNIRRRKTSSQTQSLEGEIHGMRRDRVALLTELVRLRRKQESVRTYLRLMEEKVKLTEMKQEMMMDSLLKKIQKPGFLQSLRKRKQQEIENREQRQEMISSHRVKAEPEEYGDDISEHFGGVFGYGDELHIASTEDQGQNGVETEMDNEGIWNVSC